MEKFADILEKLSNREDLTQDEASAALQAIVDGEVNVPQTAAFLYGMRTKGETIDELTSFVRVMRDAAVKPEVNVNGAVDLCGTGGDQSGTFNISTTAMFVVAGAGVPVLKHGNRSVSSKSGSADVLEKMGAVIDLKKEQVEQVFNEAGLVFMFAPNFHPAMKHVMPARRGLGIRTFFNILGPLLNPAGVRRQIIGAFNKETARQIAHILANLETEFAYTINAHDGLDEVSLTAQSEIYELKEQFVSQSVTFDPRSLDFEWVEMEQLMGGDAEVNASIMRNILDDKAEPAQKNIILLNAAFGIHASGKVDHLDEAKERAKESLESGEAKKAFQRFVEATNDVA
ncbi:anthranilate phosphoribosyltransferase [Aliifodinibius sp. S!AR15-10]|uniref:anthranilate phosphoribosyltransferase n=1 Tax=Aliifodinibius sp. S!AR15-10 TaxID=2950437 RepID=UPI002865A8A5|nr:anthranilate phosphoribosyltransferase [Aliifodinibius sp. S!AR15-10]MDR8392334.1 anthranilate phosphoribosyltransferase [Aliifodinibius sp. S!AR15-10]